jgi:uncharacterized protein involved in response to NO
MSGLLNVEVAARQPVPQRPESASGHPLFRLGFRPFYLAAGMFAVASVWVWMLQLKGLAAWSYLPGPVLHAHEMIFGFTLAVVVGFLFTAGRNWSGRPTPTGGWLAALVVLWLAARVLALTPWGWAGAIANLAFPLACAWGLGQALIGAGARRNYFFIGLLVVMGGASFAVHLSQLDAWTLPPWAGVRIALDVVLFMMVVIGGRVIPMFTNNGVPGAKAARHPVVERVALGSVLLLLVLDAMVATGVAMAAFLAVAALAHIVRWCLWQPWRTLRAPMVWILHAAYLWIPVHLALRALGEGGVVDGSIATHALTMGAIGGMTLGMMTRTARGHTARPVVADRFDTACYLLVLAAAVVRVAGALLVPDAYLMTVVMAAALWSVAFGLFALRYAPMLVRPRLDGQPG